ncbi:vacuolar protein sorting/targeting protein PEP1, partial [Entomortierella chlamydospora]
MDASWHRTTALKACPPLTKPSLQLTRLVRIALSALLLLACVIVPASLVHAAPTDPVVTGNAFEFEPHRVTYFPDSPVILLRDASRNVFRSEDEGKTWKRIRDVPSGVAVNLILHAFEPNT